MKDTPFSLDTLSEVPKIVKKNSFLTKLDDKSGYDNVLMSENSKSLLGFQWGGHYFQCNTLPFGWKNSAFVYHTLNLQAISRLRQLSVSCLLYIDDRLIEEFNGYLPPQIDNTTTRAKIAIHLAVKLFVSLGYFFNITKSVLEPVQSLVFLGMIIDSEKMSFFLTEKRKEKLKNDRQMILQGKKVPVATIQIFTGLCISMCLAIPGAKLYTSVCNQAISNATVNCSDIIIDEKIREEVQFWEFLDS